MENGERLQSVAHHMRGTVKKLFSKYILYNTVPCLHTVFSVKMAMSKNAASDGPEQEQNYAVPARTMFGQNLTLQKTKDEPIQVQCQECRTSYRTVSFVLGGRSINEVTRCQQMCYEIIGGGK